jgi:hypothetical protein
MTRFRPLHLLAAVVGLLVFTGSAQATFSVSISATGLGSQTFGPLAEGTTTIGPAVFGGPFPNILEVYNGSILAPAAFSVSSNAPGVPGLGQFTLGTNGNQVSIYNGTGGTEIVTIQITDTGTFSPSTGVYLSSYLNIGSISSNSSVDLTSMVSNMSGTTTVNTQAQSTTGVFNSSSLINGPGPYQLTSTYTISIANNGIVSFDGVSNITPSPVPATALMAVAGLPLFGLMRVLRRRKTQ